MIEIMNSEEQQSDLNKQADQNLESFNGFRPEEVFDEQIMRSVLGRGAIAKIGLSNDPIDETRGPVELA